MQNAHNEILPDINHLDPGLSGAILAGGKSRRMGRDKALLELDGVLLIEHARRLLRRYCGQIFIAGERPDLATADIPAYPDLFPGSALGGVHTALHYAEHDWVLVAACDLARPSELLLQTMLAARTDSCDAVVPVTPKGMEPLFALYHRRCLPPVEAMLNSGELTVWRLFERIEHVSIDVETLDGDWQTFLGNVNTPDDLERLTKEKQ
jgi:molybdopterin-guanine dinucleotide biosynthesis protein A